MLYFFGVFAPLAARAKSLEWRGMTSGEIYGLIDQYSGEEFAHGQTVRNTFPEADFFLRIDVPGTRSSFLTRCWRKPDSNCRSHMTRPSSQDRLMSPPA
jgi:hypothetical protein